MPPDRTSPSPDRGTTITSRVRPLGAWLATVLDRPGGPGPASCRPSAPATDRGRLPALVGLLAAVGLGVVLGLRWPPVGALVLAVVLFSVYRWGHLLAERATGVDGPVPTGQHRPLAVADPDGIDVEAVLLDAGALVETDGDVHLASQFEAVWQDRMAAASPRGDEAEDLADLVGVDPDRLVMSWDGDALLARLDGHRVGRWPSRAAFLADVTAVDLLDEASPVWSTLPRAHRWEVLRGLRACLERCPACDGPVVLERVRAGPGDRGDDPVAVERRGDPTDHVHEAAVVTCRGCSALLFAEPLDARLRESA